MTVHFLGIRKLLFVLVQASIILPATSLAQNLTDFEVRFDHRNPETIRFESTVVAGESVVVAHYQLDGKDLAQEVIPSTIAGKIRADLIPLSETPSLRSLFACSQKISIQLDLDRPAVQACLERSSGEYRKKFNAWLYLVQSTLRLKDAR